MQGEVSFTATYELSPTGNTNASVLEATLKKYGMDKKLERTDHGYTSPSTTKDQCTLTLATRWTWTFKLSNLEQLLQNFSFEILKRLLCYSVS